MNVGAWLKGACLLFTLTLAIGSVAAACNGEVIGPGTTTGTTPSEGALEGAVEGVYEGEGAVEGAWEGEGAVETFDCACACGSGTCASVCNAEWFCSGVVPPADGSCSLCLQKYCGFSVFNIEALPCGAYPVDGGAPADAGPPDLPDAGL
jgi:hypothetical protein